MLFFWTFHKKTLSGQTAKLFNIDSNNAYSLTTTSAY